MSSTFPSSPPFVPDAQQGHAAPKLSEPKHSLLNRMWHILLEAGQRRAVAEMARHVRLHGGGRQAIWRKTPSESLLCAACCDPAAHGTIRSPLQAKDTTQDLN